MYFLASFRPVVQKAEVGVNRLALTGRQPHAEGVVGTGWNQHADSEHALGGPDGSEQPVVIDGARQDGRVLDDRGRDQ